MSESTNQDKEQASSAANSPEVDEFMADVFGAQEQGSAEPAEYHEILVDDFDKKVLGIDSDNDVSSKENGTEKDDTSTTWVSLDSKEKDSFLNWLGEGLPSDESGKPTGATRNYRSSTIESNTSNSSLSFGLDTETSLGKVLNNSAVEQEEHFVQPPTEEELKNMIHDIPFILENEIPTELLKERPIREVYTEMVNLNKSQKQSDVSEEIKKKIEVLLQLDSIDPKSFYSALKLDGRCSTLPEYLRGQVWMKLLGVDNAIEPDEHGSRPFDDGCKVGERYRSRLSDLISILGWQHTEESLKRLEKLLAEFCRLKTNMAYDVLVLNLAAMVLMATARADNYKPDEIDHIALKMMIRISDKWGGGKGNWSSTGLGAPACKGVGGIAWSRETLPNVQLRRHLLLRQLIFYIDPCLGFHLDRFVSNWDIENGSNREKPLFDRINSLAESFYPSVPLFGLFSVMLEDVGSPVQPIAAVMHLWDACLLGLPGFDHPQSASFYLAASMLVLSRDQILSKFESNNIREYIDSLPNISFSTEEALESTINLASQIATRIPASFDETLIEDELLIGLPRADISDFRIDETINTFTAESRDAISNAKDSEASAQSDKPSSWISDSLLRQAEELRGKFQGGSLPKRALTAEDVIGEDMEQDLVVLSLSDKKSLKFSQTKYGLEISSCTQSAGSQRNKSIFAGDILMMVNGLLVVGVAPIDAETIIEAQDSPLYCVISRRRKTSTAHQDNQNSPPPGLRYRLLKYYLAHNPTKIHNVDKILNLYHGYEAVLLNELYHKYTCYVPGDPNRLPFSRYCLSVEAKEIIQSLFKENQDEYESKIEYFMVDCRSQDIRDATGTFPTSYRLDLEMLDREDLNDTFSALKGRKHICLFNSGNYAFEFEYNPSKARKNSEVERRTLDYCAMYFLKRNYPFVSVVQGGFLACYREILSSGYSLHDCIVDTPTSKRVQTSATLSRYNVYCQYKSGVGPSSSTILTKAARQMRKKRNSVQASKVSLSPFDSPLENVNSSISSYMSGLVNSSSRYLNADKGKPPKKEKASSTENLGLRQAKTSESWATFKSRFKGLDFQSKAGNRSGISASSAWKSLGTFSETFKSLPSKEEMTTRFRSALEKSGFPAGVDEVRSRQDTKNDLTSLYGEENGKESTAKPDFSELASTIDFVRNLKEGDIVKAQELGRHARFFKAMKEESSENLSNTYIAQRTLALACFYFIVMEGHPMRAGYAVIKSIHPLDDLVRIRFQNSNPSEISIFIKDKDDVKQVIPCTFVLKRPAEFVRTLQYVCAISKERQDDQIGENESKDSANPSGSAQTDPSSADKQESGS